MSSRARRHGLYELLTDSLGASCGGDTYDRCMNVLSLVLAILAAVYLLYAMLHPERF
jgi:K+-transporting ATPase KdpF subunit